MTGFDYGLLIILGVSVFLGVRRGLIKELLSLVSYALAGLGAIWWGPLLGRQSWMYWISNDYLRLGVAYVLVFVVILLVIGLFNMMLGGLLRETGMSGADRGLGIVYGLVRGLLISLLIVIVLGYTPVIDEPWWRNAIFSDTAENAVRQIKHRLPESAAQWLPY